MSVGSVEDRGVALRAMLLDARSVVEAMTQWCAAQNIGELPLKSRVHLRADSAVLPDTRRIRLKVGEPVFFRRITLTAGTVPLLDADNWFLPTRLPERAVELLLATDTPFGAALGQGCQTRQTTAVFVAPGVGDLGHGAVERDDVPVLTLQGTVELDGRTVSFVEERFRLEALGQG